MPAEKRQLTIHYVLFWLLSPALVVLLAAPLILGHVVCRLLIARMRRRPRIVRDSTQDRTVTADVTPTALGLGGLSKTP